MDAPPPCRLPSPVSVVWLVDQWSFCRRTQSHRAEPCPTMCSTRIGTSACTGASMNRYERLDRCVDELPDCLLNPRRDVRGALIRPAVDAGQPRGRVFQRLVDPTPAWLCGA